MVAKPTPSSSTCRSMSVKREIGGVPALCRGTRSISWLRAWCRPRRRKVSAGWKSFDTSQTFAKRHRISEEADHGVRGILEIIEVPGLHEYILFFEEAQFGAFSETPDGIPAG